MKKIKKHDLRLEKEVISALSQNDLSIARGGVEIITKNINNPACQQLKSVAPNGCLQTINISCGPQFCNTEGMQTDCLGTKPVSADGGCTGVYSADGNCQEPTTTMQKVTDKC